MFIFYSGFGLHGVCAAFCFFVVVPYVFLAILAFIFVFLWFILRVSGLFLGLVVRV